MFHSTQLRSTHDGPSSANTELAAIISKRRRSEAAGAGYRRITGMRALQRRAACASATALAAALLSAGCGGDDKVAGSASEPPPVPKIDRSQPAAAAGQPGEVVIKFWDYLRAGALPVAANAFDPRVARVVGDLNLLGALQVARGTAITYAPHIVRVTRVPSNRAGDGGRDPLTLVYVENRAVQGAMSRETFLISHSPFGWAIIYDTVTDAALRSFLITYRQNDPDRRTRLSENAATQAAGAVARVFQQQARKLASDYF